MSDLPYGPLGFPNVRAWGMAPPMAGPDPLEASSLPLPVDPPVRKKRPARKKGPATDQGVAAFDAVFQDVGGDYDKAVQVFADELTAGGVPPARAAQAAMARMTQHQSLSRDPNIFYEEMGTPLPTTTAPRGAAPTPAGYGDFAAGMAEAETGMSTAERIASAEAQGRKWDRQKAAYDRATGLASPDEGVVEEDGPYPGAGRPGYDRTLTFDEVMASRAQADADYAARMKPMNDAAKRDMSARQAWRESNPEQAESLAVGQRERSEDYRKERLLYRMAEKTGMSIEELRANNPQFSSVGQIPSRDGAGIPTLTRTADGVQLRDMPTSTSSMRDAAASKRIAEKAEREKEFRSQMMLAGGNAAKNAVNAFNLLTPEQQRDVISTRMRFPNRDGGRSDEWDRRLDMLRIQMENASTEREKDRTDAREARQAAREAEERRFADERAQREQEWKERSAQFDRDFALRQEQLTREAEANRQRHEQGMAGVSAQIEALRQRGVQGDAEIEIKRQEAQRVQEALQAAERAKRVAAESLRYGPGVEDLMGGNYGTPGAQEALADIAAESDQSWTGFYHSDARRLDAELQRLGIMDPEVRRQLVEQYGLGGMSSGSGGGRSGVISGLVNWMSGDYR